MKTHVLALCIALSACDSAESTGIPPVSCPPNSTLTYANFGYAFMTDHCLSCHASKERPTLGTQDLIRANKARILDAAVYTTAMPEDADLAIEAREMLGEWLACGAP